MKPRVNTCRLLFVILLLTPVYVAAEKDLPRIMILATGGTIAGAADTSTASARYESAKVPVDELISAVPELQTIAKVEGEQVFQIASENFTDTHLLRLARRVSEIQKSAKVDGIVITHGTDTLEETAYFLHLVLPSGKPVVLVGAMRPGTALSADGALNLYNAVALASSPDSRDKGVLITMNDEIHTARDASKSVNIRTNAFSSPWGPLGMIVEGQAFWFRTTTKRHTRQSEFNIDHMDGLVKTGIVYGHGNMGDTGYRSLVDSGVEAIIHAGTGNGSVSDHVFPTLLEISQQGIIIIRSSRVDAGGFVIRNGEENDDEHGWIVAHDLNPQKARILAAVALSNGASVERLQHIFWTY